MNAIRAFFSPESGLSISVFKKSRGNLVPSLVPSGLFDIPPPIQVENSFRLFKYSSYSKDYHTNRAIWHPLIVDDSFIDRREWIWQEHSDNRFRWLSFNENFWMCPISLEWNGIQTGSFTVSSKSTKALVLDLKYL